jgi:hypothetical protein
MIKNGITPIHVYHQGEDLSWLDKIAEYTDYIGISPANDLSSSQRMEWIWTAFEYMYKRNINVYTHGFAVWIPRILKEIPWTSCDAATWRLLAAWGGIYVPQGGYNNPRYELNPHILHVSERKSVKGQGILAQYNAEFLDGVGFTIEELQKNWSSRATVNVRYFLEMERWLNKQKRHLDFPPPSKGRQRGLGITDKIK